MRRRRTREYPWPATHLPYPRVAVLVEDRPGLPAPPAFPRPSRDAGLPSAGVSLRAAKLPPSAKKTKQP